jgi:hypothetical protein
VSRIEPKRLIFVDETGVTTAMTSAYAWVRTDNASFPFYRQHIVQFLSPRTASASLRWVAEADAVRSASGEVHLESSVTARDHSPKGADGPVREITLCPGATPSTCAGMPCSMITAAAA